MMMSFEEAYVCMLHGHKVTRPCFKGYWYIDGVTGKLTIHLANGEEITEGDLSLTVMNCLALDWTYYNEDYEACPVDNYVELDEPCAFPECCQSCSCDDDDCVCEDCLSIQGTEEPEYELYNKPRANSGTTSPENPESSPCDCNLRVRGN